MEEDLVIKAEFKLYYGLMGQMLFEPDEVLAAVPRVATREESLHCCIASLISSSYGVCVCVCAPAEEHSEVLAGEPAEL